MVSDKYKTEVGPVMEVLILVLMEFVLGQPRGKRLDLVGGGLILVTVE